MTNLILIKSCLRISSLIRPIACQFSCIKGEMKMIFEFFQQPFYITYRLISNLNYKNNNHYVTSLYKS